MIVGALAGGLVGTIVLTTGSRLAQQLGWTRMDIPFLLGTIFTAERGRATVIGYAIHFVNGLLFSLATAHLRGDRPSRLALRAPTRRSARRVRRREAR